MLREQTAAEHERWPFMSLDQGRALVQATQACIAASWCRRVGKVQKAVLAAGSARRRRLVLGVHDAGVAPCMCAQALVRR
jgi:hypothetical protein